MKPAFHDVPPVAGQYSIGVTTKGFHCFKSIGADRGTGIGSGAVRTPFNTSFKALSLGHHHLYIGSTDFRIRIVKHHSSGVFSYNTLHRTRTCRHERKKYGYKGIHTFLGHGLILSKRNPHNIGDRPGKQWIRIVAEIYFRMTDELIFMGTGFDVKLGLGSAFRIHRPGNI